MQQIIRGANNFMTLTLNEMQTLSSPYYLFRFISEGQGSEKAFIISSSDELSSYTTRFNKFLMTENVTEVLTSGVVSLSEGIWEYQVYEQTSSTNLNYRLATNQKPLEIGLAKVHGTSIDTFIITPTSDTFKWTSQ